MWGRNGEIFYRLNESVFAVQVAEGGATLEISKPRLLFDFGSDTRLAPAFDVAPDGASFLMLRMHAQERISLIFNWPSEVAHLTAEAATQNP